MTTLRITVEWLDGRYHGREWPPAPYRLYQAMVAGCARSARGDPALEAAMRHLETLPPPAVTAPPVDARTEATAAVPNNDADAALALYTRGKPALARGQTARALTRRTRRARCVEGAVAYDWRATPQTAEHLRALARIARSVTALGLGIDLALAQVSLHARSPPPAPGIRYAPAPAARRRLRVPWPGAFDALDAAYRANRARIGAATVAAAPETPVRTVAYGCALEPPPVRCAGFALRTADDRPLALEGTRAVEVAAMVRHAIGRAARAAGLDSRLVSELMGHGGEHRIRVAPLPTVGHRHADGWIRRVMLTAPMGVPRRCVEPTWWRALPERRSFANTGAVPRACSRRLAPPMRCCAGSGHEAQALDDGNALWCCPAATTAAAGRVHTGRSPGCCATQGIAEALLESATLEPAPRLAGSAPAYRYRRPRHLAHYPVTHLSVTWRTALVGPLALGAGTGYGLGLLVPAPD